VIFIHLDPEFHSLSTGAKLKLVGSGTPNIQRVVDGVRAS